MTDDKKIKVKKSHRLSWLAMNLTDLSVYVIKMQVECDYATRGTLSNIFYYQYLYIYVCNIYIYTLVLVY